VSLTFYHVQQLSRDLSQYLNQSLADEDISMSHWAVIFQLHHHGAMTQTDLKNRLNIEAPPLSRTLRKLEQLGYIHKHSSTDKRTNDISLSEKGEKRFPIWQEKIKEAENRLRSGLGEEGEQILDRQVRELTRIIHKERGGEF
jgi:MarR family transcriptional regulator for hemolysin